MDNRATIGSAFGALLGAITGAAMLTERVVNTSGKTLDIADNMLDAGVKKSDNFKKRSALADDAEYLMEITSLIQLNPDIGQVYLSSPDMLPEGITIKMVQAMIKPKVIQKASKRSRTKSKSSVSSTDFNNTDI